MSKVVKSYIYHGLGFPVKLSNVEFIKYEGEYTPKINVKKVADKAIRALVLQKNRLTGNQIKFVRSYFGMSLREFADLIHESHMAVKKWEDYLAEPTKMDRNIEIVLRLHIYDQIVIKHKAAQKEKLEFYQQFLKLTKLFSQKTA